jgi:membrane-associated protein
MIARLLDPFLRLHGWEAYTLVGALVFAEASLFVGFIFPGETAVVLGGVLASRHQVNLVEMMAVVVVCAISGDSVGYFIGQRWGRRIMDTRPLRKRRQPLESALAQLTRRGAIVVILARFTAFLRAVVPGLAGISNLRYRVFFAANAVGGLLWGVAFCLLGYFAGNAYKKVEHASSIASDVLLGLLLVGFVVLLLRRWRRHRARSSG